MRIDLNHISLQDLAREDKTRKAGLKNPSSPSVEDKTSLSADTPEHLLAASPGDGDAGDPAGQGRGPASGDPER